MSNTKIQLKNLSKSELDMFVSEHNLKPFRARQLYHWLYQKNVSDFSKMTTLKKSVREFLTDVAELHAVNLVSMYSSQLDVAHKFLFSLADNQFVETVYMEDANRRTVCVSSQVGCALKCDFCATGKMGYKRNLTAAEIVDQLLYVERYLGVEATNIVFMGMGEPFLNYEPVMKAAETISDPEGIAISKRKITISTSGIIPAIKRFTDESRRFKLAISLNATTNEKRRAIMPITKKYPLMDLLSAIKDYTKRANSRVTFEYILIAGVNDSLEDAKRLRRLLAAIPCKINLIPYNSIDARYQAAAEERIDEFLQRLTTFSAPVTVRRSKGQDIQAACGQLYTEILLKKQKYGIGTK